MGFFDAVELNLSHAQAENDSQVGLAANDAANRLEMAQLPALNGQEQDELTPHESLFVAEYLKTFSATQAARNARYAPSAGSRLMGKANIRNAISKALGDMAMAPGEIVARYSKIARSDMGDFVTLDESGYPRLDIKKAENAGLLGNIKKLKYDDRCMPEIELHDPLNALEKLAKINGMMTERVQVDTHTTIDANITRQIMVTAMKDPDTLAELGELAERLQAGANVVEVKALPS